MPFCPSCRCEYRMGFTCCNDCSIELVDSLPEETRESPDIGESPEMDELELVELSSFPDPMEAQMIQELLENNGIESILQSDFSAGAGPYTASPNALLVRKTDFLRAREIYEQYFERDQAELPPDEESDSTDETDH